MLCTLGLWINTAIACLMTAVAFFSQNMEGSSKRMLLIPLWFAVDAFGYFLLRRGYRAGFYLVCTSFALWVMTSLYFHSIAPTAYCSAIVIAVISWILYRDKSIWMAMK